MFHRRQRQPVSQPVSQPTPPRADTDSHAAAAPPAPASWRARRGQRAADKRTPRCAARVLVCACISWCHVLHRWAAAASTCASYVPLATRWPPCTRPSQKAQGEGAEYASVSIAAPCQTQVWLLRAGYRPQTHTCWLLARSPLRTRSAPPVEGMTSSAPAARLPRLSPPSLLQRDAYACAGKPNGSATDVPTPSPEPRAQSAAARRRRGGALFGCAVAISPQLVRAASATWRSGASLPLLRACAILRLRSDIGRGPWAWARGGSVAASRLVSARSGRRDLCTYAAHMRGDAKAV